jgi:outer membrane biosynthesis protein TonB
VRRRELSPALAGSIALHLIVAAALLISWRFTRELTIGAAVPVTLVANGPPGELRDVQKAPEVQEAQAEQPQPEAPPQPAPPAPTPAPEPPAPQPTPKVEAPTPKPKPQPKPAEKAAVAKPQPVAKPEKSLDLDALAASVSKLSKAAGGKPGAGAKGPPKAATAPETGKGLSASAQASVGAMKDAVERRWNPNCNVAGGRDVQVSVTFRIDSSGQVIGDVGSQIRSAQNEVSRAAADRAVRAVYAAAPFRDLPRELYGQSFKLNFDAKDACS